MSTTLVSSDSAGWAAFRPRATKDPMHSGTTRRQPRNQRHGRASKWGVRCASGSAAPPRRHAPCVWMSAAWRPCPLTTVPRVSSSGFGEAPPLALVAVRDRHREGSFPGRPGKPRFHLHQAIIASSNRSASSSSPKDRGESFVTRCCGSVPATSAGISSAP